MHVQQVRMLELERTQHKLLLESLQQRHQEDLDLLESAHRYRALTTLYHILAYSPFLLPWVGLQESFPNPSPGWVGTKPC